MMLFICNHTKHGLPPGELMKSHSERSRMTVSRGVLCPMAKINTITDGSDSITRTIYIVNVN